MLAPWYGFWRPDRSAFYHGVDLCGGLARRLVSLVGERAQVGRETVDMLRKDAGVWLWKWVVRSRGRVQQRGKRRAAVGHRWRGGPRRWLAVLHSGREAWPAALWKLLQSLFRWF
jgi:hypothetical protein